MKRFIFCLLFLVLGYRLNAQTGTQLSGEQIKDGAITNQQISENAGITWTKLDFTGITSDALGIPLVTGTGAVGKLTYWTGITTLGYSAALNVGSVGLGIGASALPNANLFDVNQYLWVTNSGSIGVAGNVNLTGDLGITGTTSLTGDLGITGNLDVSGTVTANGVTYTLPSVQGAATSQLVNDGSGALVWEVPSTISSPLTTKGDLYTYSTVNARQPVGIDGGVLVADSSQSTGLAWFASAWTSSNATASRAKDIVYQNTTGKWLLIEVTFTVSGTATNYAYSDASATPTTQVASLSMASGFAGVLVFLVQPSHYCKITGANMTMVGWYEHAVNIGTLSASAELHASRAYNTAYQNTSGSLMFVAVQIGTGGTTSVLSDAANPPTVQIAGQTITGGTAETLVFPVLAGHYYKLTNTGSGSIDLLYEYTWAGVTCTRSASLAGRPAPGTSMGFIYQNISKRSLFTLVTAHNGANGTLVLVSSTPPPAPATYSVVTTLTGAGSTSQAIQAYYSSAGGALRSALGLIEPWHYYGWYIDTNVTVIDNWFEWLIY